MADLKIDELRRQINEAFNKSKTEKEPEESSRFARLFEKSIQEVNQQQLNANQAIENYVTGKDPNLHQTLIALEKADISFKMMMQVRNKLIEAYQDIMRTSV